MNCLKDNIIYLKIQKESSRTRHSQSPHKLWTFTRKINHQNGFSLKNTPKKSRAFMPVPARMCAQLRKTVMRKYHIYLHTCVLRRPHHVQYNNITTSERPRRRVSWPFAIAWWWSMMLSVSFIQFRAFQFFYYAFCFALCTDFFTYQPNGLSIY